LDAAGRSLTSLDAMRQEDIWDQEAAQAYDTPGTGMFAPDVLGPAVDRLAELAGDGRALEFAIGTGRVAIPLAQRGVPVTGIELSRPMIGQLRAKAGETAIPVIAGDMATIWPSELDLMAQLAGFELEARHADWAGTEFTAGSPSHVSVYRLKIA
jgi:SAM-dependent methyltransferase